MISSAFSVIEHSTTIGQVFGLVVASAGALVGAIGEQDAGVWVVIFTGLSIAAISTYQRFRKAKREEDMADEKALADSRLKLIRDLTEDVRGLTARAENAERACRIAESHAAALTATVNVLRHTCPHKESCPVSDFIPLDVIDHGSQS